MAPKIRGNDIKILPLNLNLPRWNRTLPNHYDKNTLLNSSAIKKMKPNSVEPLRRKYFAQFVGDKEKITQKHLCGIYFRDFNRRSFILSPFLEFKNMFSLLYWYNALSLINNPLLWSLSNVEITLYTIPHMLDSNTLVLRIWKWKFKLHVMKNKKDLWLSIILSQFLNSSI